MCCCGNLQADPVQHTMVISKDIFRRTLAKCSYIMPTTLAFNCQRTLESGAVRRASPFLLQGLLQNRFVETQGLRPTASAGGSRPRSRVRSGGDDRDRTDDLRLAKPALSQLSYIPDVYSSCFVARLARVPAATGLKPATKNGGPE